MTDPNLIKTDPQPSRADAVKNRALLLETAQRLFTERGVENVTMTDIADAANVGKGTLYRHFENKNVLCQTLLDEDQRALQERSLAYLRSHSDAKDNLKWFLREALGFVQRNRPLLCAGDMSAGSLEYPAHWWWRLTIRGLLSQLQAAGDLDYMTDTLYVMLDVHTIYFLMVTRGYSLERIADGLSQTVEAFCY